MTTPYRDNQGRESRTADYEEYGWFEWREQTAGGSQRSRYAKQDVCSREPVEPFAGLATTEYRWTAFPFAHVSRVGHASFFGRK
jgi:hypothetical protein